MNALRLTLAVLAGTLLSSTHVSAASADDAELRACGHGQERKLEGAAARKPSIELVSMLPADSSYVTEKTLVVAELEYSIDRFEPGMYQLNAQFETVDPHATAGGLFIEHPELQYAHGTLRFCYPLRSAWLHPTLKWPLSLIFNLTRRNDDGSTRVIASTSTTRFNAAKLPAHVLNRAPPDAEQVASREAAEKLSTYFESVRVHVQLCVETFPDLRSSLLPPLADWGQRHAKVQEKSDALYMDVIRRRIPGITNADLLAYLQGARTVMQQGMREVPQALSRRNCELMPDRLAGDDYDPAKAQPEAYERVTKSR